MKTWIGAIMIISGVILGLYAGVWWAFIGGIVDVIQEVRAVELSAVNIAIGIAKVMFAGLIGFVSALLLIAPGYALTEL